MLRNIEFIHTPRQVGKTTKLVRIYKEHLELGRQVYLLTFSEMECKRLRELVDERIINPDSRIMTLSRFIDIIRYEKFKYTDVLILIDESFMFCREEQQDFIGALERHFGTFDVLGYGTLTQRVRKDFTHYLREGY